MPDLDFFRPKELPVRGFPQRQHRHIPRQTVSGPVFPRLRRWIPDRAVERLDAWLWHHSWIHFIVMTLLISGLFGSLIYLTLKAARMEP